MKKFLKLRDGRQLTLGEKTLVMGILNVTPDSFSDGGKYFSVDAASAHAAQLIADGADILDVGAESTRPNATPISADEELARLEKIFPLLKSFGVPVSIDTYKPEVAAAALEFGADIINDVSGLADSRMIDLAKKFGVPLIVMHSRKFSDDDIISDVKNFFARSLESCAARGLDTSQIIFDPGIGFGKTTDEDLTILCHVDELKILGGREIFLMVGPSRKKFIGYSAGIELQRRDAATGAVCVYAAGKGADIVRVHNVKMISQMCRMTDILLKGGNFDG